MKKFIKDFATCFFALTCVVLAFALIIFSDTNTEQNVVTKEKIADRFVVVASKYYKDIIIDTETRVLYLSHDGKRLSKHITKIINADGTPILYTEDLDFENYEVNSDKTIISYLDRFITIEGSEIFYDKSIFVDKKTRVMYLDYYGGLESITDANGKPILYEGEIE